jgi:succinate-semialdehyde dehydrogenase/glutarate-semialdehyde dehydrogenase
LPRTRRVHGKTFSVPAENRLISLQRQPVGVVAAARPRSFLAAMLLAKMPSTLAVGCTAALEHSEFTPFSDLALGLEAGLPADDGALISRFHNMGQACARADRVLFQVGACEEVAHRLGERVAGPVLGDGLEGVIQVGPLINAVAMTRVRAHVEDAVGRGAGLPWGVHPDGRSGYIDKFTVLADVTPAAKLFREETFRALAGLVRSRDEAQAVAPANDTTTGRAAYVCAYGLSRAIRVPGALELGVLGLKTRRESTAVVPLGGIKESELGREGARPGLNDPLDIKTICTEVGVA